jgi:hypothetical protein
VLIERGWDELYAGEPKYRIQGFGWDEMTSLEAGKLGSPEAGKLGSWEAKTSPVRFRAF